MEILDKILQSQVIGVLLGGAIALLSPILVYRMDKKKKKVNLKSEIIYTISLFYGISKFHIQALNSHALCHRFLHFKNLALIAAQNDIHRVSLSESVASLRDEVNKFNQQVNNNYTKLVEVESKLIALVSKTKEYYGYEIFKSLSSLVNPIIKDSNNQKSNFLFEYWNLQENELININTLLSERVAEKQQEQQKLQEDLIKELNIVI